VNLLAQAGLLLGAALLQVTLVGRLDPSLPQPNLVLALVVARAWMRGGGAGLRWALAGGLLLDLMGIGPLGGHALALLAAAYAVALLAASFEQNLFAALAGAAGGALYGMVLLALSDSLGLAQVSARAALPLVLQAAAATAVLVPVCVALITLLGGRRPVEVPSW